MTDAVAALLEGFPVSVEIPLQWGEMDAYGHVNNAVYFRYFETARMRYFDELGFQAVMDAEGVGPILAHTACRFRMPLQHPDTLTVGVAVGEIGADRFEMHYRVISGQHGKLAAEGTATIVSFDYRAGRKAPIPQPIRDGIAALQA